MNLARVSNNHITRNDCTEATNWIGLVFTCTRKNRPCILTMRMNVGGNTLTLRDMPRDNHNFCGLCDH